MNNSDQNGASQVESKGAQITKDIFINLAMLLSLGASIFSFVMLVKVLMDTVLPDQFNCGCDFTTSIIYYLSALIVSFGAYSFLSWKMRKDEANLPLHHSSVFHQIAVYLALFVSGLIMARELFDIFQQVLYFGFTTAIFIRIILIILVVGALFAYYVTDIKKFGDVSHSKLAKVLWWVAVALVLGSIVGSFIVIGSPTEQKGRRFDEERLADLSNIKGDIEDQYNGSGEALPKTLKDFYSEEYLNNFLDPESNKPYEYQVTGPSSYKLCTTFGAPSDTYSIKLKKVYGDNATETKDPWAHTKGHTCFDFTVDNVETDPSIDDAYYPTNPADDIIYSPKKQ